MKELGDAVFAGVIELMRHKVSVVSSQPQLSYVVAFDKGSVRPLKARQTPERCCNKPMDTQPQGECGPTYSLI